MVRVNKAYLKFFNQTYEEVIGGVFLNNAEILDGRDLDEWDKIYYQLLNKDIYYFSDTVNIFFKNKTHWLDVYGTDTTFNGKPAVLIVLTDITEQKIKEIMFNKKSLEAIELQNNLNIIQSLNKTAIAFIKDDIVTVTPEFYNIIDYIPSTDSIENFDELIIKEDRRIYDDAINSLSLENNNCKFIVRIKTYNGNIKYIQYYVKVISKNDKGSYDYVTFFQDVTEPELNKQKLDKKTKEAIILANNLDRIQSATKSALCYSKDMNHCISTPELSNILETDQEGNDMEDYFVSCIMDFEGDPKQAITENISPNNPDYTTVYKINTYKNNIKYIKNTVHQDFDKDGNLLACVCSKQDITNERIYANELKQTLHEKEILLKEVHHRVKNNLQIILSLINLNKRFKDDPESIIDDTQNRINAMALIHEKIYGSESLAAVNIKEYTESIVYSLFRLYDSDIIFHSNLEPIELDMEEAIPLGLILNELLNNTIKYAFPEVSGNLFIDLKKVDSKITLVYKDDGIGLPDDFDFENLNSLGMVVVKNLTNQIDGNITIMDCDGTGYILEFNQT